MPASVRLDGFDEFAESLATLPEALVDQSKVLVQAAADATVAELLGGYPEKTGAMKKAVTQVPLDRTAYYGIDVKSTMWYAIFWEKGTVVRTTKKTHANRGQVQPHLAQSLPVIGEKHQALLQQALAAMLRDNHFEVSGA